MSVWIARTKNDIRCDVCNKNIKKGEKRLVIGIRSVYVIIDKNICFECWEKEGKEIIKKLSSFSYDYELATINETKINEEIKNNRKSP